MCGAALEFEADSRDGEPADKVSFGFQTPCSSIYELPNDVIGSEINGFEITEIQQQLMRGDLIHVTCNDL